MSTKTCPQCGATTVAQARFCGQCGRTFGDGVAGVTTEPGTRAIATTVDEATADPPTVDAPSAAADARGGLGKTRILGGAGESRTEPLAPAVALGKAGSDKQTMLGMPAVDLSPRAEEPAQAPPPAQALLSANKTMLGVAIPGIAPTHEVEPPPAAFRGQAGTLLGVAVPGVAPTSAGAPPPWRPPQERAPAPPPAPPPIVPAPAPLEVEPLPAAPRAPKKEGVPAIVVVGIVFAVVAVLGTAAAVLAMRSGAPLTARPQLDESGKESLAIRCESCPDGTVVSLGAASARVEGKAAVLPLPEPLSIGDNGLEMSVDRPAPGRDETVKVHVPVAYRVKADLSTLSAASPAITVLVEAAPGTEVVVDDRPVVLDTAGRGTQSVDVSAEVSGPSDDAKAIDRKIAFAIKPKGAPAPETGELVVRAAVVPLHVDAPGRELYTDRATGNVAGQTRPGGTVTIDGQSVAVDPEGRFAVRVELPTQGDKTITIVANAPPLAPRTVRAKLVRVASLDASARALEAKGPLGFDAYGADPASKRGELVAVDGEILEIRVSQGHTVMLVDEKKTCGPGGGACIVRVVHGEEIRAARGDGVRVYGRVEGTVSSGGKSVPAVEGALAMTLPAGKR